MSPTMTVMDYQLRPPWPDEMPRLKQFLRGSMRTQPEKTFLKLALAEHPERIVGAYGLPIQSTKAGKATAKLYLKVRPLQSRKGLDLTLLESAIREAREQKVSKLAIELAPGDPLRKTCEAIDFKFIKTEELWQMELKNLETRLDRLSQKLGACEGWIFRCPEEADTPRLIELSKHFQFRQEADIRFDEEGHLPGKFYSKELSTVIIIEGQIVASMLLKASNSMNTHADLRMVDPRWFKESGRLNFILLREGTQKTINQGYTTTSLTVNLARDAETRNFAKRTGGKLLKRLELLTLDL